MWLSLLVFVATSQRGWGLRRFVESHSPQLGIMTENEYDVVFPRHTGHREDNANRGQDTRFRWHGEAILHCTLDCGWGEH